MNKLSVAFIFFALVMLVACDPADKYKAELKQLDSVLVSLDSAQLKFAAIDTIGIHKQVVEMTSNLDFIEKNNTDTLNRATAFALSDYTSLLGSFKKINKAFAELASEEKKSKEQISNLIHDLKFGKIKEEKVAASLEIEKTAANKVVHGVQVLREMVKINSEKFETNNSKVLEYIELIKAKQTKQ